MRDERGQVAGATPARSQAFRATGCRAVVAQRNTAWPSWKMNDRRSLMKILSAMPPSLPQTTGPDARPSPASAGPTTAAPAPSAKMMQVERSVQSTHWESFSAPMTSTCREVPARTASLAVPSA